MKKKSAYLFFISLLLVFMVNVYLFADVDKRDFDGDGDVDAEDLVEFIEKYGTTVWYKDADLDGYSDGTSEYSGSRPDGYFPAEDLISPGGDCNDQEYDIHPGAIEVCDDGLDNNCDGNTDYDDSTCVSPCEDNDGDGYGDGEACLGFDCDDGNADRNPGADDICDGIDNDCDGATDEGLICP